MIEIYPLRVNLRHSPLTPRHLLPAEDNINKFVSSLRPRPDSHRRQGESSSSVGRFSAGHESGVCGQKRQTGHASAPGSGLGDGYLLPGCTVSF